MTQEDDDGYDWAGCTGLTASWCPRCGDCTCRDREAAMNDADCPLHNPKSAHALPSPREVVNSIMRHPHLAVEVYKRMDKLFNLEQTPEEQAEEQAKQFIFGDYSPPCGSPFW